MSYSLNVPTNGPNQGPGSGYILQLSLIVSGEFLRSCAWGMRAWPHMMAQRRKMVNIYTVTVGRSKNLFKNWSVL